MSEIREGLVEVIGASIHYQVSGHGPTLLLLSPGDGDADVFSGIAPLLEGFTVVTCDRRGQARSAIVDPAELVTIATHADDMARVLVAVTTHGARVFGAGLGAVIGLELVARHPHRVSTLVAFEPSIATTRTSSATTPSIRSRCARRTCRSWRRPAARRADPGRTVPRRSWHAAWPGR
jgi:pimeloyl-ACP methyl ester carboxylesterase